MNNKNLMIGIAIVALLALVAVVMGLQMVSKTPSVAVQTTPSPSDTNTTPPILDPSSEDTQEPQNSKKYTDPQGIFSFTYPNEYTLDTQNGGKQIRIYKRGPSQTGQTEMFDGVMVVFEPIPLNNQTLEGWIDTTIKTSTADGTLEITDPKKPFTLNNYPGFTYEVRGLGTSRYYVIHKTGSSQNALNITTLVADPKNQGFQKEVDTIFSTLEILK